MASGWIKIHRSLLDNDLWTAEQFSYGQAWVDLLMSANYVNKSIFIRGIEIPVKRGQIAWSELSMSKRWKWSRGKVRRYLGMLENRGMVIQQKSKVTTILTICNYSSFQELEKEQEQQAVQQTEQQAVQQTDNRRYTTKEVKKGKKDTTTPKKKKFSGDDMKTAEYFIASLRRAQPDIRMPNLDQWADTVRLMREQDNRTHSDICRVWQWARNDPFWQANILSAKKLREKYDQLKAKMGGPHATSQHNNQPNALRRIEQQARDVYAAAEAEEAGLRDVGPDEPAFRPQVVEPGGGDHRG